MPVHEVIEKGNQRSGFASSGHVCRSKIRYHWRAHTSREYRAFSQLPCARDLLAEKIRLLTLMVDRLPVTTHQIYLWDTAFTHGSEHGIGIEFAEQEIQPRDVAYFRSIRKIGRA